MADAKEECVARGREPFSIEIDGFRPPATSAEHLECMLDTVRNLDWDAELARLDEGCAGQSPDVND